MENGADKYYAFDQIEKNDEQFMKNEKKKNEKNRSSIRAVDHIYLKRNLLPNKATKTENRCQHK